MPSDDSTLSEPPGDLPESPARGLRSFAGYEVVSELGRGGMGIVYRARQVTLNRTVAPKEGVFTELVRSAEAG